MSNRTELPADPRRILLIKPSALGDVVHTLPVLKLLRQRWPDAKISWLVSRPFAGLLRDHPLLDEPLVFDRRRFGAGWYNPRSTLALLGFVRALRARRFDLVVDLQGLLRTGLLGWISGAATRIGFANAREGAAALYTHHVRVPSDEVHAIDRYRLMLAALGCATGPVEFDFHVTAADEAHVDQLLEGIGRFAVLLPATNWQTKRWGVEQFAALVQPLRQRFGLASVVAGGMDAVELAPQIPADLSVAGKTSLPQLVALLARADLVIANDSGPMHIAAALGRPLVAIFGPTNPLRTGPYQRPESVLRVDLPCSPCYSRKCSHISCMRWISVEAVLSVATEQLAHFQSRVVSESM